MRTVWYAVRRPFSVHIQRETEFPPDIIPTITGTLSYAVTDTYLLCSRYGAMVSGEDDSR